MSNISLFLKEVLSLLAIVEPLGAIPIFLSLTSGMSERKQKVVARRAALAGFLILLSALVFGKWLLQIFGISLPSIRVGGGLLFIVMGLQLILSDHHDKITESEKEEAESIRDIAVVPLALPILAGPGAMGVRHIQQKLLGAQAVLLAGHSHQPLLQRIGSLQDLQRHHHKPVSLRVAQGQGPGGQRDQHPFRRSIPGGISRHPDRLVGSDVGAGDPRRPAPRLGSQGRQGQDQQQDHPEKSWQS